jgi:hypothetical protein
LIGCASACSSRRFKVQCSKVQSQIQIHSIKP